jgi:diguanylate cyclase (GGDEF)-like protein
MMKPAWHEVVASLETSVARRAAARPLDADGPVAVPETAVADWTPPVVFDPDIPVDPLTGRLERRALVARLAEALERRDGSTWALLVFDIDGFRSFNYELGCAAGDALLRAAADRLAATIRQGDLLCRYGSDEFAVLLADVAPGSLATMAERLMQALARPFPVSGGGLTFCPQASAGMTVLRDGHARPEDVLREAERALARAKTLGGGRFVVHDAVLDARPLALADLETALRRALDTEEFRRHYQPIVSVKGGQVAGFEVLLWRRSGGGRNRTV